MAQVLRTTINVGLLLVMGVAFVGLCVLWAHMLNDFNHYSASQLIQPDVMKSF